MEQVGKGRMLGADSKQEQGTQHSLAQPALHANNSSWKLWPAGWLAGWLKLLASAGEYGQSKGARNCGVIGVEAMGPPAAHPLRCWVIDELSEEHSREPAAPSGR